MTSIFSDIKIMAKVAKEMDLIIILKNTSYIVYTIPIIGVKKKPKNKLLVFKQRRKTTR